MSSYCYSLPFSPEKDGVKNGEEKREKMAYDGGQCLHFVGLSVQIMTTELGCMEFDWRSFRLILHTVLFLL